MTVAFDTETGLIQNGLLAPPLVCLTWCAGGAAELIPSSGPTPWGHIREWFAGRFACGESFITYNGPFDFGAAIQACPDLAPEIFRAHDAGRVHDIQIVERLGQIASGFKADVKGGLAAAARRYHVPVTLDKSDGTRTNYGRLLFRGIEAYSPREREYALTDAVATWETYRRARVRWGDAINDDAIGIESAHAFWLHLVSAWGLRTSSARVADLRDAAYRRLDDLMGLAKREGLVTSAGKKNDLYRQMRVLQAHGNAPRDHGRWQAKRVVGAKPGTVPRDGARTDIAWQWDVESIPEHIRNPTGVKKSKVALQDSGDPVLATLGDLGQVEFIVNNQLPMLEAGVLGPVHTRYWLADTLRTTSSGDEELDGSGNEQNHGRNANDDPWLRVRDAYEPRPGMCYVDADVTALEMNSFAQVLINTCGRGRLAQKLNSGIDPHVEYAAKNLLGYGYQEALDRIAAKDAAAKDARQFAKIPNYGKLGGQGVKSLIRYARQQGIKLTEAQAAKADRDWRADNPDAVYYQRVYVDRLRQCRVHQRSLKGCPECAAYDFQIPGWPGAPTVWRRFATFTSTCNGHFQGLGARIMKLIGWRLMHEAWTDRASPLWIGNGVRIVRFVHDSFLVECPIGSQHDVAERLATVMRAGLAFGMPDLRTDVAYHATFIDCKSAKRVIDPNTGRLAIWEPKQ